MARIYGEIVSSALMTFDKSFARSNGQPLDSTEIFYSLVSAQEYALTDVAYVGQKIVVVETKDDVTTVTHYGIEADGSLKELGAIPVGDDLTIEVVDGKIQLAALEGHKSGTYQPFLVDGKIEWREPSATTVEGLDSRLTSAEDTIEALEGIVGKEAEGESEATGLVKSVSDNAAAIDAEKTAREDGDKANSDAISAINTKIGEVEEGTTLVDMIAAAEYDDTDLSGRVKTIEDDYLKAADRTDLEGAIEAAEESAVNRILGYLAEEEVNASYDTLKEVAAWIESDTTASAELITRVTTIENDYLKGVDKEDLESEIAALSDYVGDMPEGAASTTVVAYIQEVVDALNIGDYAKASELTALADRVVVVEGKAHEHANKTILDSIDDAKIAAWDGAQAAAEATAHAALDKAKEDLTAEINKKVDAETGKSLISDTLIAKLEAVAEGAQVNVIDSVDEAQFAIDADKKLTLLDIAMGKVTGLQDALDAKANKGTTLEAYGITDAYTKTETEARIQEVLDGLSDTSETAASVAQALETYKTANDQRVDTIEGKLAGIEDGAQVNVIESVKVGDTVLEITEKAVIIPVGAGLKASDEVTIAADGALGIGEVNVNKLVQTDGEFLILNGGASAI
jgi:hypothetical protein